MMAGKLKKECHFQVGLGKTARPYFQTKVKRTRGMAQEVECLSCKCEALSSNPNTANK
jgi:hypothetical protein